MPPRKRTRTRPDRPDLPPGLDPAPDVLDPGAVWDGVQAGEELDAPRVVPDLEVRECRFTGVDLSGRSFPGLHVRDTVFTRCDLSGAVLDRAVLERVVFDGCRLTGTVLSGATLRDVHLTACRADLLALRMATATFLLAEDTGLRGADLHEFTGTAVALLGCDLTGADLDRAALAGAHLHGSVLDDVQGALSLRGARIDAEQQIALGSALLAALDVRVTERP